MKTPEYYANAIGAFAREIPQRANRRQLQKLSELLRTVSELKPLQSDEFLSQIDERYIPTLIAISSGRLKSIDVLQSLADADENQNGPTQELITGLAYPFAVVLMTMLILLFFSFEMAPAFQEIFRDFDANLPAATLLMMSIADIVRQIGWFWLLLPIAIVVFVFVFRARSDKQQVSLYSDSMTIGNFSKATAELLLAGLPIARAIELSGRSVGKNSVSQHALWLANEFSGVSQSEMSPMPTNPAIPELVQLVLCSDQDDRTKAIILNDLSDVYAAKHGMRIQWMTFLLEPISIVCAGAFVGFLVITLFMPLVSLISNLSG